MIENYEIKYKNNEQILILYLDFNYEFANLNFKEKKQNLENMVQKFIKEKRINFKGKKVILIVGGIAMATLLLSQPIIENIKSYTPIMETVINKQESLNQDVIEDKEDVKVENILKDEQEKTEVKDETINKPQTENEKIEQNIVNKPEKETEIKKEENNNTTETNKSQEKDENKVYVTIYRTNGTVSTIELEEYVIGVVAAEMPASFNSEALKTQAIIARTYALKMIENSRVLTDDSSTQNYKDDNQLKAMWGNNYNTYYNKIKKAVLETQGVYLTYNGEIIEAVYHSTSNGYTEDASNVWGNEFAYLVSVESEYDYINSSFIKQKYISYEYLSKALNMTITQNTEFNIISYTSGQRVQIIEIDGNEYTGVEFRNLLGLRSADFEIKKEEQGLIITTKGYGHGVGLSQYGANGMAKNGYTYEQILKHYYKGVKIKKM